MIDKKNRKVKVIGYLGDINDRKVCFINFFRCANCNTFPTCANLNQCTFTKYIKEHLSKEKIEYGLSNSAPLLRISMPDKESVERAQLVISRAHRLRANRAIIRQKVF